MLNLSKYNQVVFDCDGVILDSNNIKSEAFAKSLIGEDKELVYQFIKYHKENGGISRFVKFEYFFKVLKKQKNYQKDLDLALKRYSKLSYDGLINCQVVPGIENILNFLFSRNIDCFVVSGGEQNEVRSILEIFCLSNFFNDILGSPVTKKEHLKNIQPSNALYFGDAWSDYDAAKAFDMNFIFISGASEWTHGVEFCKKNNIHYYSNFNEIDFYN